MSQSLTAFDRKTLSYLMLVSETVTRVGSGRLAAAIVINKRRISVGTNSVKTLPLMHYFNKHPQAVQQHAEISAIHLALKTVPAKALTRATLYIARTKEHQGSVISALACPCQGCQRAIVFFGIKRVVYTQ
jgi:deoxycytidylate deaminase